MAEGGNYRDDVFSREVRAGKRKYFFDVKTTRGNDLFMTITESKRSGFSDSGQASYEKHKIFLYKEDFDKFIEGLEDTINHIRQLQDTGDFRSSEFATSENENSESNLAQTAPAAESSSEESTTSSSDISFDDL
ncbi:MAG: PUR family DNA/RNA-binding protein [Flavobacteriales bacterium]|jgi:hypothetical protein|nr:PUR family DNA/RNA-binding protein [Flavobacteriales bacterium]MDP4716259.1 PUR family DNA/RNA-binding protein [Flavobacteriales bacterium]MDP4732167.1 PUR family DNA/RNA-binding protein [Flavobacteriales bacterium]MDP4817738.1 PUR family DNA/RNA-binding protein [Flavobacteriales bacterium]MDP4950819.1 PUR family DNA/RNA-binding protein [Flavobacteriales bacterium]